MKRFLLGLALTGLFFTVMFSASVVVTGCKTPSQQKFSVNTITSTHLAVDTVLDGYLDLVIKGQLATNNVPIVLKSYATYQAAYNTALVIVLGNTNAPAPVSLSEAAKDFTATVNSAKKGSL